MKTKHNAVDNLYVMFMKKSSQNVYIVIFVSNVVIVINASKLVYQ